MRAGLVAEPGGGGSQPVADGLGAMRGLALQGERAFAEPGGLLVGAVDVAAAGDAVVKAGRVLDPVAVSEVVVQGGDAVRLARETRADVVLMDIRMPGLDELAATRRIAADDSLAGVRVLILTTFEVDEYVFEALRSGASGFLGKGARPDVLIDAVRTVARGDALLSPSATRGLIARFLRLRDSEPVHASPLIATLTDREREVVALVADGMSNAEIARQLTLSPLTVKTHANHAMTKLGARDRAQLVVLAYQTGLARAPRPGRELPRRGEDDPEHRAGVPPGEKRRTPDDQPHYPERSRGGSQSPGMYRFELRRPWFPRSAAPRPCRCRWLPAAWSAWPR